MHVLVCTCALQLEELQQEQQERYGNAVQADGNGVTAANSTEQQPQQAVAAAPSTSAGSSPEASGAAAAANRDGLEQREQREQAQEEPSSDDGDLDYEGGEMCSIERQLLSSCLVLLAASTGTLKAFGKALLQGPQLIAGTDALDSWESCLFHSRHLKRAVEDLGAAMYPPQVCVLGCRECGRLMG